MDFFSKCDQICKKLRIWLHLLKKYLMENYIFRAVFIQNTDASICDPQNNDALVFVFNYYDALSTFHQR